MPRLSDSMEEGTILKWMKGVGDEVALGDELVEIETDKANMVFEADAAGTLIEIVAGEGDTLPIGEVIARVGEASEAKSADAGEGSADGGLPRRAVLASAADSPPGESAAAAPESEAPAADEARTRRAARRRGRARDSRTPTQPVPGSRRRRAGQGVARWRGGSRASTASTSPPFRARGRAGGSSRPTSRAPGRRRAAAAAPAAQAAPPPGAAERPETAKGSVEVIELTKLQQTVSRRMAESKATAPHFYLQAEVDMTRAVEARAALKAAAGRGRGGAVL